MKINLTKFYFYFLCLLLASSLTGMGLILYLSIKNSNYPEEFRSKTKVEPIIKLEVDPNNKTDTLYVYRFKK